MSSMKAPRGTVDILPEEAVKWQYVETKMKDICNRYHFDEFGHLYLNIQKYSSGELAIPLISSRKKCTHLKTVGVEV